ncbi:ABC transporter permease [Actinomyces sp. 2119]|uniref:ABC transporter permease subunit n=1 Tax=Actinomyces sp. 2119 TaxID=2321393 RepID=UPI000E6D3379|nr:ABC transporter permease subunit [Actinomyces sp. 2119]RJF41176.1 ABC transporter permease [Actinomyces sp. 2119]
MTTSTARAADNRSTVFPILRWQLRSGTRGLIGWSIGLFVVIVLYLPVFPSLQTPEVSDMIDSLPQGMSETMGLDSIATGAGYAQATYFGLLGFLLSAMACIIWGSHFIAGSEESGRLELTLSHAVERGQYALESLGTLVARVLVLCGVTLVGILALNGPAELSLSLGNTVTATLAWGALALLCGTTALAVGAATGRQSWAIAAGATVTAAAYAFDAVGRSSTSLDWLSRLSPYHWAFGSEPLATGNGWGGIALLCGVSTVLFVIGYLLFSRRDLHG